MFAVRSVARVSDPAGPTARLWRDKSETDETHDPFGHVVGAPPEHKVVWQEMWDYMCGHAHGPRTALAFDGAAASLEHTVQLERRVLQSTSEMVRLGSAYELGKLAADNEGIETAAMALRALQRLLTDPAEATRRAASYGLTAAGQAALTWLNSLLRNPVALESVPPDPQPNVDVKQGIVVQVMHAVAHCATRGWHANGSSLHGIAAAAATTELVADTVGAVHEAMRRAATDIETLTAAATPHDLLDQRPFLHNMYQNEVPLNFHVIERRRTLAEGAVALGLIGAKAVANGHEVIAAECCAALIEVASNPEPGLAWAAFMTRGSVIHNAALGLIRLTSDPRGSSGASVPHVHTGGGWADEERRDMHNASILQGMIQEARRRGTERLGQIGLLPSSAALEGVLRQIEAVPWVWTHQDGAAEDRNARGRDEVAPTEWKEYVVMR